MGCDFSNDTLQWCFSTLGCPELDLPGVKVLADRFGIRAVELRAMAGSVNIVPYLDIFARKNPEMFEELSRISFVKMLDTSFCLAGCDAGNPDELIETARMADRLHAPFLRVFGGFPYADDPPKELIVRTADTIRGWDSVRERYEINCTLALETHDGFSSAANCLKLFDRLGRPVPIVWDVHHSWRYAGEDPEESFQLLKSAIVHVQVKDGVQGIGAGGESVLPGTGEVPMKPLLQKLRAIRFGKPVSLEWERMWKPSLPALDVALSYLYRNWLR